MKNSILNFDFFITPNDDLRLRFGEAYGIACNFLKSGISFTLKVDAKKSKRSIAQNALMWAILSDISKQVVWYERKLTSEEWKDVLTAALKKQDVVPAIDGGFVIIGMSTSRMTIAQMNNLLELMLGFAASKDVKITAPAHLYKDAKMESEE